MGTNSVTEMASENERLLKEGDQWCASTLLPTERRRWSDEDGAPVPFHPQCDETVRSSSRRSAWFFCFACGAGRFASHALQANTLSHGWSWMGPWERSALPMCDSDGWLYGVNFSAVADASPHDVAAKTEGLLESCVRRRIWQRRRVLSELPKVKASQVYLRLKRDG
jgi:hypothetical protein